MALPTWKSLAKTHVSATSVCQRQKAITATGGCSPAAGHTCGYVLRHKAEPVCYLAGDTIWYSGVRRNIDRWHPQVIIVNAGGNKFYIGGHVIMHIPDVMKAMDYAPWATFVATHLEGVNHNQVSRAAIREEVLKCGKKDRIHTPEDGEIIEL